jgi:hypothetical protein
MTEIQPVFLNIHGKTRKIDSGVDSNTIADIKDTLKAVNGHKPDFLEIQRAFYKGGFKDSKGVNRQKQFDNLKEKHQGRLQ